MKETEFYKVYGAAGRNDSIIKLSGKNYLLIFGFGKDTDDAETGYNWRKNYDHEPTETELKEDIKGLINTIVDEKILSGYSYDNHAVWLSSENQFNYKAAYDMAVQLSGQNLPVTFKLGTDAEPYYKKFETLEDLGTFYTQAMAYMLATLQSGWDEKDNLNIADFKKEEL